MPRVRYKAWLLVLPAALFAFLLYVALSRWLGLPTETLGDFAMLMSLLLMPDFVGESRPANRRHWATLAAAVLVAALAAAVTAVGVVWLLARAAPDFTGGFLAVLAILFTCSGAILLTLWAAHRLTRADNLIFPRSRGKEEEGVG